MANRRRDQTAPGAATPVDYPRKHKNMQQKQRAMADSRSAPGDRSSDDGSGAVGQFDPQTTLACQSFFAIRRTGIYSTMITLALAQMLYFICLQAEFTGGEDGLQGVPRGKLFGLIDLQNDLTMYYVALAVVVIGFLVIVRTVHSPYGQVLKAIKENEPRAISLGYDTNRFKLLAFVLSAALSGLAGSLKTLVLGFATLSDAHWTSSGHVVLMTLVGGLGTLSGPLVGSAVVVLLENKIGELGEVLANLSGIEWFHTLGESVTIVTGFIFLVCVLAFRRGIMGELIAWMDRLRAGKKA